MNASKRHRSMRVFAAAVAIAALATYANTLGNGFVWDDHEIVVGNPLNRSLANIPVVLSSADVVSSEDPTPYYRPLSRLSYLIDHALFGLEPAGYHAVNVLAHALVALLAFAVARKLMVGHPAATVVGLLVAVHPIHAEPVNFVTARNNMLASAFVLLAAVAYLRSRADGRVRCRVAAGVLLLGGLLCKEIAITLLPVAVVAEVAAGGGPRATMRRVGAVLATFTPAVVVYFGLRLAVLDAAVGAQLTAGGIAGGLRNVLHSVPKYLQLVLLPRGFTVEYLAPERYFAEPIALAVAWAAIFAGTVLAVAQRRPLTLLGLLWWAVNFAPVSTIVPFPSAPMADRYLYLPVMGLWLAAADQVRGVLERGANRVVPVGVATAVLVVILAAITMRRNLDWRDDVALFGSAVRAEPRSPLAHFSFGVALREAGDAERARVEWERALDLDPLYAEPAAELGRYHAERGAFAEGERHLRRVLTLRPGDPEAHFNLALLLEKTGRAGEAVPHYRRYVEHAAADAELSARVRARIAAIEQRATRPQTP